MQSLQSQQPIPNTPSPSPHGKTALLGILFLALLLFATAEDQVNPSASPISQWQLIAFNDFNATEISAENEFSMIGDNRVLGGYTLTSQTLSVPVAAATYTDFKLAFDFYFIDSWDDEFAELQTRIHYSDGSTTERKTIWREAGHAHFFPSNITGNIYRDFRTRVQVVVDHFDAGKQVDRIDLFYNAELDRLGRDESWAVDNLEIYGR